LALSGIDRYQHRLEARAEIEFALMGGITRLKRSLAEPPLQVQRALYLDQSLPEMAFLFLLNPTPGIFQGDVQRIQVQAGPGARVHLTTPSATKIYAMPDRRACQVLDFSLAAGAYLEYLPEPLIPFRGARLVQRTTVNQSHRSVLVFGDVVLPGRTARGESFAFHSLDRRLTVMGATGQPVLHEASILTPLDSDPLGLTVLSPGRPVTGTLLVVAPDQEFSALREQLQEQLQQGLLAAAGDNGHQAGITVLPNGAGLALKVLSRGSPTARAIIRETAEIARRYFLGPGPVTRLAG
jgi:urease accessory protein